MDFDNIIGQQRIKDFFRKALESQRISHAYLFVGDRGVGKEAMALELARAIFCSDQGDLLPCGKCSDCRRIAKFSHPDLQFIFPAPAKIKEDEHNRIIASMVTDPYLRLEIWANPSISIEKIREIRRASAFKSLEGKGRVVILVDAERMTIEAANALLKILEEPPDKTYLVLISSKPNLLLPTILSRCQVINFEPLTAEAIEKALVDRHLVTGPHAPLVARLASGSFRRAVELLDEDLNELRTDALELFRKSVQNDYVQLFFVEELLHKLQRDSKKIRDLLNLLSFWFRDAMVFAESNNADHNLVNFDQVEVLQKFVASFPEANLYGAVREIEASLNLMNRNVQINLILVVLLNKLRSYIRGDRYAG